MSPEADTFHLFALFPTEIRLLIWRSTFTTPQRITVDQYIAWEYHRCFRYPRPSPPPSPPALLLANKEAHRLFLSAYEPFHEKSGGQVYTAQIRKRYINKSVDIICVPGPEAFNDCEGWWDSGTYKPLAGIKYLEIDHVSESFWDLRWFRGDKSYECTNPQHVAKSLPAIRFLQSSLEMVTIRPMYANLTQSGCVEGTYVYEPPTTMSEEAGRFTSKNLGHFYNKNTVHMLETLALAFGMTKDGTHHRGPKIVAILATKENRRNSTQRRTKIAWELPHVNEYTKCKLGKRTRVRGHGWKLHNQRST